MTILIDDAFHYTTSFLAKLGFLPLSLFIAGILYLDAFVSKTNVIGTIISAMSGNLFGLIISSSTLFVFFVVSIIIYFFVKVNEWQR